MYIPGTIEITLGDYNDNPPKFSKDSYVFNGAEGNYMITESFVEQVRLFDNTATQFLISRINFTQKKTLIPKIGI